MRTLLKLSGILLAVITFCVAFMIPLLWIGVGMNYTPSEMDVDSVTAGLLWATMILGVASWVCLHLGNKNS